MKQENEKVIGSFLKENFSNEGTESAMLTVNSFNVFAEAALLFLNRTYSKVTN